MLNYNYNVNYTMHKSVAIHSMHTTRVQLKIAQALISTPHRDLHQIGHHLEMGCHIVGSVPYYYMNESRLRLLLTASRFILCHQGFWTVMIMVVVENLFCQFYALKFPDH